MFRHLILATTIAVALSGCTQMAADSRPHTDTGTPDISTFLHPKCPPRRHVGYPLSVAERDRKTLGFRGGRAERAAELRRTLEHRATTLLMPCTTSGRCSARKAGCHR